MAFREFFGRARASQYFGLIFWTPFWLLPVLSETGILANEIVENIAAGIAASALLEAIASMVGERRRYFYLVAGVMLWIGAGAFIAYAVVERGMINSLALFDASQYTTANAQQFSYVSDVGDVPPWLLALCAPFLALQYYWRHLGGPRRPVYAAVMFGIFLLPIPLKAANCAVARSCLMRKFYPQAIYPAQHYAPIASYMAVVDMLKLRRTLQHPLLPHPAVTAREAQRPLTLVVIVGESLNRNHMSLYGYCRPTTPNLDAAKLFVFRDVVSMLPLTSVAVPRALRIARYPEEIELSGPSLVDILNAGGFSTSWISNQLATDLKTGNIVAMARSARRRNWLNVGGGLQNYNSSDPRDEDLLAPFAHALAAREPRKSIFLHINGAHWLYSARYPANFAPAAIAAPYRTRVSYQNRMIFDYDRAVRYDDVLVGNILAQLAHKGGDTALVMFSDHGEEVFDQIDWHGHAYPNMTRNMVEIPFFVWLSPALQAHRPELVRALQAALAKRMQNRDITATVADIANLSVAGVPPDRRPLTPQFRPTPRRGIDTDYDIDRNLGVIPVLPPLCPARGR